MKANERGGYISTHYGFETSKSSTLTFRWRWIFYGLSCVQTVVVVMTLLFLPETNAPIILDWRTARLRKEGRKDVISPMETGHTPRQIFTKYLLRPFKVNTRANKVDSSQMLLGNPIVFSMAVYLYFSLHI